MHLFTYFTTHAAWQASVWLKSLLASYFSKQIEYIFLMYMHIHTYLHLLRVSTLVCDIVTKLSHRWYGKDLYNSLSVKAVNEAANCLTKSDFSGFYLTIFSMTIQYSIHLTIFNCKDLSETTVKRGSMGRRPTPRRLVRCANEPCLHNFCWCESRRLSSNNICKFCWQSAKAIN